MKEKQVEIISYQYQIHSCLSKEVYAIIRLHSKVGRIAKLIFLRDTSLETACKQDEIDCSTLYYMKSDLPDIIEILRNEKPVYFVHDENNVTRIATGQESVGNQE